MSRPNGGIPTAAGEPQPRSQTLPKLHTVAVDPRSPEFFQNLSRLRELRDAEGLVKLLQPNQDSRTRSVAALTLGAVEDDRAAGPLAAALADTSEEVRYSAAIALGSLGDERAIGPLIQALESKKRWARSMASWSLLALGEQARPALEEAARKGRLGARFRARRILRRLNRLKAR